VLEQNVDSDFKLGHFDLRGLMSRLLIEPVSSLWNATDENSWFRALCLLGRRCGFDQALFAVIPRRGMRFTDAYLRSNFDACWRETYEAQAFARIDPTVLHCLQHASPLVWSASVFADESQQRMYEQARTHGLYSGVSLPIHGPRQEVGILSLVCGEQSRRELDKQVRRHLPMLTLLRDAAFDAGQRFLTPHTETLVPKLTPREHECLKWTAQGKSTWEIARIFGCSEATVNFHMANIRNKFGVSSRSAAAVKATRMGLIDLD
jgi:LuxR family quorum-sensing transcriptional regulator LasR